MHSWQKTLRSVYLDAELQRALEERARTEGVPMPGLIVEYVDDGLKRPEAPSDAAAIASRPLLGSPSPAKKLMSFYLPADLHAALEQRAAAEASSHALLVRFCREGLAAPPSDGRILRRTQERFVAERKAKIQHLTQVAREAIKAVRDAEAEFAAMCPHLHRTSDLPIATCQDCDAIVTRP